MNIQFTSEALQDITDIADYIRGENPQASRRVRDAILESIKILADFPGLGRLQADGETRKLTTSKYGYLVFYRIEHQYDEVIILAIYHHARNVDYPNR